LFARDLGEHWQGSSEAARSFCEVYLEEEVGPRGTCDRVDASDARRSQLGGADLSRGHADNVRRRGPSDDAEGLPRARTRGTPRSGKCIGTDRLADDAGTAGRGARCPSDRDPAGRHPHPRRPERPAGRRNGRRVSARVRHSALDAAGTRMLNTDFRGRENNQALGGQAALFPGICSSRFPDR
jgi:hypothetical protein